MGTHTNTDTTEPGYGWVVDAAPVGAYVCAALRGGKEVVGTVQGHHLADGWLGVLVGSGRTVQVRYATLLGINPALG